MEVPILMKLEDIFKTDEFLENISTYSNDDTLWVIDLNTGVIKHTQSFFDMLSINSDRVKIVSDLQEMLHPEDIDLVNEKFDVAIAQNIPNYQYYCRVRHDEGHYIWINVKGKIVKNEDGTLYSFGSLNKLVEPKTIQEIMDDPYDGYIEIDYHSEKVFFSDIAYEILDIPHGAIHNIEKLYSFVHKDDHKQLKALRREFDTGKVRTNLEVNYIRLLKEDGGYSNPFFKMRPIFSDGGPIKKLMIWIRCDEKPSTNVGLQDSKEALSTLIGSVDNVEDKLELLSRFKKNHEVAIEDEPQVPDEGHYILDRIIQKRAFDALFAEIETEAHLCTYISVGIFQFSEFNMNYSFDVGDELILQMIDRLKSFRSHSVKLFYNDAHFNLLVKGLKNQGALREFYIKIYSELSRPYVILGKVYRVNICIGVDTFSDTSKSIDTIRANSLYALKEAKSSAKNSIVVHQDTLDERKKMELELHNAIIHNLMTNHFYLYFQPKVNLKDNSVIGVEALVRMNDDKLGMIPPDVFIPVAENTKLIVPVGERIMEESFILLESIDNSSNISINISSIQLEDPDFICKVKRLLEKYNVIPDKIEFELTERATIASVEKVAKILTEVRDLGIKISLDDFGTGYSTLTHILKLPVDIIKIDKSFVDDICNRGKEFQIVQRTIELAHSIGAKIISEGVETAEQQNILSEMGCDFGQGYYFSKPVAKDEAIKIMKYGLNQSCS